MPQQQQHPQQHQPDEANIGGNNPMSPRDVPDDWYPTMVHYVMGFENVSHLDLSAPIIKPALADIYPLFVVQYVMLAVVAIIGNVSVLTYVIRHRLYRDVTHAFLTNLSVAHLVLVCMVMPMTVMVIIIQNWIYGQFMCFFTPLLQDIPMHVALLSHLLIAWDRMRWLSDPMCGRLPSFVCSFATWLTGMIIALPFPIYTTYLDMGQYFPKFHGVGICIVNLVDDMHEYMRGIFVIMYALPSTSLAYLYVRTPQAARMPDSTGIVTLETSTSDGRDRQRNESNTPSATRTGQKKNAVRSFDLYDTNLDAKREQRTQRYLAAMAATQVVCVCPLMFLKIARMVLVETYENSFAFDICYLLFVWVAFMPTCINPILYGAWVLSRPMKQRLRGYFRLSSRQSSQDKKCAGTVDAEMSTTITSTATAATSVGVTKTPRPSSTGGGGGGSGKVQHVTQGSNVAGGDSTVIYETNAKTSATQRGQHHTLMTTTSGAHRSNRSDTSSSNSSSLFSLLPLRPKAPRQVFARSTEVRPSGVYYRSDSAVTPTVAESRKSPSFSLLTVTSPTSSSRLVSPTTEANMIAQQSHKEHAQQQQHQHIVQQHSRKSQQHSQQHRSHPHDTDERHQHHASAAMTTAQQQLFHKQRQSSAQYQPMRSYPPTASTDRPPTGTGSKQHHLQQQSQQQRNASERRGSSYSADPLLNSCSDITSLSAVHGKYSHASQSINGTNDGSINSSCGGGANLTRRHLLELAQLERKASLSATEVDDEFTLPSSSRCTSVSTYTNELEMDALERRRSLVLSSPLFAEEAEAPAEDEALEERTSLILAMRRKQKLLQQEHEHLQLGYVPKGRSMRRQMSLTVERAGVQHATSSAALATGRRLPAIGRHHAGDSPSSAAPVILKTTPVLDAVPAFFPNQVFTHQRAGLSITADSAITPPSAAISAGLPPRAPSLSNHPDPHRISKVAAAVAAQSGRIQRRSTALSGARTPRITHRSVSLPVADGDGDEHTSAMLDDLPATVAASPPSSVVGLLSAASTHSSNQSLALPVGSVVGPTGLAGLVRRNSPKHLERQASAAIGGGQQRKPRMSSEYTTHASGEYRLGNDGPLF